MPWSASPIRSQSRASASKRRATALSPPAVFSMQHRGVGLEHLERAQPAARALGDVVLGVAAVDDHRLGAELGRGVAGLLEDLARAVADVRLRRADVDQVRRMHVDVDRAGADLVGLGVGRGLAPRPGVGQEDLHAVGVQVGGGARTPMRSTWAPIGTAAGIARRIGRRPCVARRRSSAPKSHRYPAVGPGQACSHPRLDRLDRRAGARRRRELGRARGRRAVGRRQLGAARRPGARAPGRGRRPRRARRRRARRGGAGRDAGARRRRGRARADRRRRARPRPERDRRRRRARADDRRAHRGDRPRARQQGEPGGRRRAGHRAGRGDARPGSCRSTPSTRRSSSCSRGRAPGDASSGSCSPPRAGRSAAAPTSMA